MCCCTQGMMKMYSTVAVEPPPQSDRGKLETRKSYIWCCRRVSTSGLWLGVEIADCAFLLDSAGTTLLGRWRVVPAIWSNGTVAAKVGRLLLRTCVTASKPEASLINVGSLNAVPKKLIPRGTPNTIPAGTCTIGYPSGAASPEVPKMKWSP